MPNKNQSQAASSTPTTSLFFDVYKGVMKKIEIEGFVIYVENEAVEKRIIDAISVVESLEWVSPIVSKIIHCVKQGTQLEDLLIVAFDNDNVQGSNARFIPLIEGNAIIQLQTVRTDLIAESLVHESTDWLFTLARKTPDTLFFHQAERFKSELTEALINDLREYESQASQYQGSDEIETVADYIFYQPKSYPEDAQFREHLTHTVQALFYHEKASEIVAPHFVKVLTHYIDYEISNKLTHAVALEILKPAQSVQHHEVLTEPNTSILEEWQAPGWEEAVLKGITVDYSKSGLADSTVYHGTIAIEADSVKKGPQNIGRGMGGAGLYVDCDSSVAIEYAGIAGQSGKEKVVLEGYINPNKEYKVARIQLAPRGHDSKIDYKAGVFPAYWAKNIALQALIHEHFDILEVCSGENVGYAIPSSRFLVIHERAQPDIIQWTKEYMVYNRLGAPLASFEHVKITGRHTTAPGLTYKPSTPWSEIIPTSKELAYAYVNRVAEPRPVQILVASTPGIVPNPNASVPVSEPLPATRVAPDKASHTKPGKPAQPPIPPKNPPENPKAPAPLVAPDKASHTKPGKPAQPPIPPKNPPENPKAPAPHVAPDKASHTKPGKPAQPPIPPKNPPGNPKAPAPRFAPPAVIPRKVVYPDEILFANPDIPTGRKGPRITLNIEEIPHEIINGPLKNSRLAWNQIINRIPNVLQKLLIIRGTIVSTYNAWQHYDFVEEEHNWYARMGAAIAIGGADFAARALVWAKLIEIAPHIGIPAAVLAELSAAIPHDEPTIEEILEKHAIVSTLDVEAIDIDALLLIGDWITNKIDRPISELVYSLGPQPKTQTAENKWAPYTIGHQIQEKIESLSAEQAAPNTTTKLDSLLKDLPGQSKLTHHESKRDILTDTLKPPVQLFDDFGDCAAPGSKWDNKPFNNGDPDGFLPKFNPTTHDRPHFNENLHLPAGEIITSAFNSQHASFSGSASPGFNKGSPASQPAFPKLDSLLKDLPGQSNLAHHESKRDILTDTLKPPAQLFDDFGDCAAPSSKWDNKPFNIGDPDGFLPKFNPTTHDRPHFNENLHLPAGEIITSAFNSQHASFSGSASPGFNKGSPASQPAFPKLDSLLKDLPGQSNLAHHESKRDILTDTLKPPVQPDFSSFSQGLSCPHYSAQSDRGNNHERPHYTGNDYMIGGGGGLVAFMKTLESAAATQTPSILKSAGAISFCNFIAIGGMAVAAVYMVHQWYQQKKRLKKNIKLMKKQCKFIDSEMDETQGIYDAAIKAIEALINAPDDAPNKAELIKHAHAAVTHADEHTDNMIKKYMKIAFGKHVKLDVSYTTEYSQEELEAMVNSKKPLPSGARFRLMLFLECNADNFVNKGDGKGLTFIQTSHSIHAPRKGTRNYIKQECIPFLKGVAESVDYLADQLELYDTLEELKAIAEELNQKHVTYSQGKTSTRELRAATKRYLAKVDEIIAYYKRKRHELPKGHEDRAFYQDLIDSWKNKKTEVRNLFHFSHTLIYTNRNITTANDDAVQFEEKAQKYQGGGIEAEEFLISAEKYKQALALAIQNHQDLLKYMPLEDEKRSDIESQLAILQEEEKYIDNKIGFSQNIRAFNQRNTGFHEAFIQLSLDYKENKLTEEEYKQKFEEMTVQHQLDIAPLVNILSADPLCDEAFLAKLQSAGKTIPQLDDMLKQVILHTLLGIKPNASSAELNASFAKMMELSSLIKDKDTAVKMQLLTAEAAFSAGCYEIAEQSIQQLLASDPKNHAAFLLLIDTHIGLGSDKETILQLFDEHGKVFTDEQDQSINQFYRAKVLGDEDALREGFVNLNKLDKDPDKHLFFRKQNLMELDKVLKGKHREALKFVASRDVVRLLPINERAAYFDDLLRRIEQLKQNKVVEDTEKSEPILIGEHQDEEQNTGLDTCPITDEPILEEKIDQTLDDEIKVQESDRLADLESELQIEAEKLAEDASCAESNNLQNLLENASRVHLLLDAGLLLYKNDIQTWAEKRYHLTEKQSLEFYNRINQVASKGGHWIKAFINDKIQAGDDPVRHVRENTTMSERGCEEFKGILENKPAPGLAQIAHDFLGRFNTPVAAVQLATVLAECGVDIADFLSENADMPDKMKAWFKPNKLKHYINHVSPAVHFTAEGFNLAQTILSTYLFWTNPNNNALALARHATTAPLNLPWIRNVIQNLDRKADGSLSESYSWHFAKQWLVHMTGSSLQQLYFNHEDTILKSVIAGLLKTRAAKIGTVMTGYYKGIVGGTFAFRTLYALKKSMDGTQEQVVDARRHNLKDRFHKIANWIVTGSKEHSLKDIYPRASRMYAELKKDAEYTDDKNTDMARLYASALFFQHLYAETLKVTPLPCDGNSLFKAISAWTDEPADVLRQKAVELILSDKDTFKHRIEVPTGKTADEAFTAYTATMAQSGTPGDAIVIDALSRFLDRPIILLSDGLKPEFDQEGLIKLPDATLRGKPIFVACQDVPLGKKLYGAVHLKREYYFEKQQLKNYKNPAHLPHLALKVAHEPFPVQLSNLRGLTQYLDESKQRVEKMTQPKLPPQSMFAEKPTREKNARQKRSALTARYRDMLLSRKAGKFSKAVPSSDTPSLEKESGSVVKLPILPSALVTSEDAEKSLQTSRLRFFDLIGKSESFRWAAYNPPSDQGKLQK